MGRTTTPKYVVVLDGVGLNGPMAWDTKRHGAPTDDNAEKYAMKFAASLNPGGCNEHIRNAVGGIPYPTAARIQRNTLVPTVVAQWRAAMFQIYPSGITA